MSGLQIHDHADKQSQECSGGTRRKLSFAMAMVGGPKVVLMDEPSTGMDPRSKRFLWDTILASFQVGNEKYSEAAGNRKRTIGYVDFGCTGGQRGDSDNPLHGGSRRPVFPGGNHG